MPKWPTEPLPKLDRPETVVHVALPIALRRRDVERHLVLVGKHDGLADACIDPALAKNIVRARRWFDDLAPGRVPSLRTIAESEGISDRYAGATMPSAFLAPEVARRVLSGTQSVEITTQRLVQQATHRAAGASRCTRAPIDLAQTEPRNHAQENISSRGTCAGPISRSTDRI